MRGQRAMPKRKLKGGTGPGRRVEAKGLPRLRRRGRCSEKVAENLVPEVPPARAQAGPGSRQPAPLRRTSAPRRCSGHTPWPPCPLGSFVDTPPQLLSLRSLEGIEGRDRGRRTYRGATLGLLDKAKAALYLERPRGVFSARSETTKVLFCFLIGESIIKSSMEYWDIGDVEEFLRLNVVWFLTGKATSFPFRYN